MLHCASSLYTRELKVIVLYQPFQTRTIPRKLPTPLPPLSKVRCCRPKKFGRLPEGLPHHHPLLSAPTRSTILKSDTRGQKGKVYNKRIPTACFGNGDSVLYICFTLSIYPHRQQAQRFRVRDYPSSQAYIRRPKFRLFHRCRQASAYSCYRLPCRLRSACRCLYGR